MAACPNCTKSLNCGCQRRTASDKTQCCTNCLSTYEFKLKQSTGSNPQPPGGPMNITVLRTPTK